MNPKRHTLDRILGWVGYGCAYSQEMLEKEQLDEPRAPAVLDRLQEMLERDAGKDDAAPSAFFRKL